MKMFAVESDVAVRNCSTTNCVSARTPPNAAVASTFTHSPAERGVPKRRPISPLAPVHTRKIGTIITSTQKSKLSEPSVPLNFFMMPCAKTYFVAEQTTATHAARTPAFVTSALFEK